MESYKIQIEELRKKDKEFEKLLNEQNKINVDIKEMERFFVTDFRLKNKKEEYIKIKEKIINYLKSIYK